MVGIEQNKPNYEIWCDAGGTFTDCILIENAKVSRSIKILSNGSFRQKFIAANTESHDTLVFSMPPKTPDQFLTGKDLRVFISGEKTASFSAKIVNHDPISQRIVLSKPVDPDWLGLVEIDAGSPAPIVGAKWLSNTPLSMSLPATTLRMGTTRVTNALLERRGERVLFVATAGFEDLCKIGDQTRRNLFDLQARKFEPLTTDCIGVVESINKKGQVERPIDVKKTELQLKTKFEAGLRSVAIALKNSYKNSAHEVLIGNLARRVGFREIYLSHQVNSLPGYLERAETTLLDAYLGPVANNYFKDIEDHLGEDGCLFIMASDGSLKTSSEVFPRELILSGPAGGGAALSMLKVEGTDKSTNRSRAEKFIGFDMGGTSTDVCRYDGAIAERKNWFVESEEGSVGTRVSVPAYKIETVAAGGGSVCWFDGAVLRVGPHSAGSDPGPACYGKGGDLTITDCNAVLGLIDASTFPFELNVPAAQKALDEILSEVNSSYENEITSKQVAESFREIALNNMAAAIRSVSIKEGADPSEYHLVSFGGAGGQHACELAEILEMKSVIAPRLSSVFCALGMGLNKQIARQSRVALTRFNENSYRATSNWFEGLACTPSGSNDTVTLRYSGQLSAIDLPFSERTELERSFHIAHQNLYGFSIKDSQLEIVKADRIAVNHSSQLFQMEELVIGARASSMDSNSPVLKIWGSSVFKLPNWHAQIDAAGNLQLSSVNSNSSKQSTVAQNSAVNATGTALFFNALTHLAEEMGSRLEQVAWSSNIRDRRDFSCAVFDHEGNLLVNAPHIPVHLGAMSICVRHLIATSMPMQSGDMFVTNDPYAGGSHLPDVTVIAPVFLDGETTPVAFVANRAHHSEIGGISPGSMPADSTMLSQEGIVIKMQKLVSRGTFHEEPIAKLLSALPFPSRAIRQNLSDLKAQVASNKHGIEGLEKLSGLNSSGWFAKSATELMDATERKMIAWLNSLGPMKRSIEDELDDGTKLRLTTSTTKNHINFDWQLPNTRHPGNLNTPPAVVFAATLYTLRTALEGDIPLNDGLSRAMTIRVTPGSFLSPISAAGLEESSDKLPAVVAGNVETSQRLVEMMLRSLGLCAESQGTMNNIIFGGTTMEGSSFSYYETLGGGSGAGPNFNGTSGVQSHMTNSRITDPEIVEWQYPFEVTKFALRKNSGGRGRFHGGDGIEREYRFKVPTTVSIISSRRRLKPRGLSGGDNGSSGKNIFYSFKDAKSKVLNEFCTFQAETDDRLNILTPGGGGFHPSD